MERNTKRIQFRVRSSLISGLDCESLLDEASRTQCETMSASQYMKYLNDTWNQQSAIIAELISTNKGVISNFGN